MVSQNFHFKRLVTVECVADNILSAKDSSQSSTSGRHRAMNIHSITVPVHHPISEMAEYPTSQEADTYVANPTPEGQRSPDNHNCSRPSNLDRVPQDALRERQTLDLDRSLPLPRNRAISDADVGARQLQPPGPPDTSVRTRHMCCSRALVGLATLEIAPSGPLAPGRVAPDVSGNPQTR